MAIVTISQIKHRRGIKGVSPMPQLASAEFGWAVDAQELYIGNGTIVEGAPAIGNTEILTEHSDLTALLNDYTYAGPFLGATMQTGVTAGSPIVRTNDEHDDDRVNVRSFGALADGITDDHDALERAIDQHYRNQPGNGSYWTTIYLPAGVYRISKRLRIPSRVRLVGDGWNSTIIQLDGTSSNNVIEMERVLAVDPQDIYFSGIGFVAQNASSNVCSMSNASDVTFERCAFAGASASTLAVGAYKSCVLFANDATTASTGIKFKQCKFQGATYAIVTAIETAAAEPRQDVIDVTIESCVFYNLYKGIVIGYASGNTPSADPFPKSWRVSNSFFDLITLEGIHCYKATKITSAMNHFADVGNLQAATPTASNIVLGDNGGENPIDTLVDLTEYENNYSIGDTFDRTDADDATIQRITTNCLNSYVIDPSSIRHGTLHVEPGRLIRLVDNTAAAITTGITLDSLKYQGAIIDYQLNRGADLRRTGTLTLGMGDTVHNLTEDFIEAGLSVGVTFSVATAGSVATIEYTTTAGAPAQDTVLSYSIRHLTCLAAPHVAP